MSKAFASWRGTLGLINPAMRPGVTEELIRLLPDGIGVIPLFNSIREGSRQEFTDVIGAMEAKTAELAAAGVDVIHPGGSIPFMLLGFEAEARLVAEWEERFNVPIITAGRNHIAALRAFDARRFVALTYFGDDINGVCSHYFADAGFDVLDIRGIGTGFAGASEISSHEVYRAAKAIFLSQPRAEAIYLLGAGWRTLDVIGMLEEDCGVPVIQQTSTLCWEVQCRLHVRQQHTGYGRLLADMPALPAR